MKKHTISILVENKFGALNRIVGLFSARGYNIDSISVGTSEDDSVARVTIVSKGDDDVIEQIIKQLNKLIDVTKVADLTYEGFVERELILIKVAANRNSRPELMQISEIFRSKIVDISPRSLTIEATGNEKKVDAMIKMLAPFGIKEIARTGQVALKREFEGTV
ncbi:MAG TPA: acetolactate synthase small subunit [Candidatus Acidoferrales bacterium]|nr:acetolactate synthase small subunit [Candidatus Acidoferrales bacterium]